MKRRSDRPSVSGASLDSGRALNAGPESPATRSRRTPRTVTTDSQPNRGPSRGHRIEWPLRSPNSPRHTIDVALQPRRPAPTFTQTQRNPSEQPLRARQFTGLRPEAWFAPRPSTSYTARAAEAVPPAQAVRPPKRSEFSRLRRRPPPGRRLPAGLQLRHRVGDRVRHAIHQRLDRRRRDPAHHGPVQGRPGAAERRPVRAVQAYPCLAVAVIGAGSGPRPAPGTARPPPRWPPTAPAS